MQCKKCGKGLKEGVAFCPECGAPVGEVSWKDDNAFVYGLAETDKRKYSITVNRRDIQFAGKFWYLKEKEFVRCTAKRETAMIKNFMGMGRLAKRSPKKTMMFVLAGVALEVIKAVVDKISEWVDKANDYLQWVDREISLPAWVDGTVNAAAVICILLAVWLFFSKKKVIEISFTDKRICVPEKSMTAQEYNTLYQSIVSAKKSGAA